MTLAAQAISRRLWSPTSSWHPGGLAWSHATSIGLVTEVWDDAWAEIAGDGLLRAHVAPGFDAARVVDWYEANADGPLGAEVPDGHSALIVALHDRGYIEDPDAHFTLDMLRSVDDAPDVILPEGFSVRSIEADEMPARVEVHRAAWEPSKLTEEKYERVMREPLYRLDLDIVAVAPDGTFAACCIAWLDDEIGTAEIEPVGTDPRFRRLGLASAVCAEAIHRVAALGGVALTIHPRGDDAYPIPRQVYANIGFKTVNRTRAYVKS